MKPDMKTGAVLLAVALLSGAVSGCSLPFRALGAATKAVSDTAVGMAKSGVKVMSGAVDGAANAVKAAKGNAPLPEPPNSVP
jgi:hypothetical protein